MKRDSTNLNVALAGALLLAVVGCKQQKITSYEIPKEDYSVKPLSMPGMGATTARNTPATKEREEIKYAAPKGWQAKQAPMGGAAFHLEGDDGKFADIKVMPLRAGPSIEEQSVNMWRKQMRLAELPANELKGESITVGGSSGHFYDLKSEEPLIAGKFKARTTAAVVERDDTLWFLKMEGEDSVVTAQQDTFKDFLKSIHFEAPATQVATASDASNSGWKTPEGWTEKPAGQMQRAVYNTPKGGVVSVSVFDGETGGLLANINRWRGQMGQAPIKSSDLGNEVKTVELSDGSTASAVEVAGTNAQTGKPGNLYGLIVTRGAQTWFYKLTGAPDEVAAQAPKLVEFAGDAH